MSDTLSTEKLSPTPTGKPVAAATACSGPSKSTIRRRLKDLRDFIDAEDSDPLETRIAYEVECAIRWARENTVAWPSPLQSARETAELIRQEFLNVSVETRETKAARRENGKEANQ